MTNKVKPFFIDAKKHNLSEEEADSLLALCKLSGVNVNERYNTNPDHHGIEESPYFGVMLDCTGKFETFVCGGDQLDDETEISPEDVDTWLSHGLTKEDYIKKSMETLDGMLGTVTEDNKHLDLLSTPTQKPTLGLLTRKQWVTLRQYDIVRALARQADNNELLNEEWVGELVDLFGSIKGEGV